MKLENEFTVDVSVEDVWEVLLDLERITPCLPGAALTNGSDGDGEHDGSMKVRLGPVTQEYKGTVQIQEADESQRRAVLQADGKDSRGQGTASATITSTLHDEGNGSTRVHVETDMQITGRAAQFGRGIQQSVAEKLLGRFADCLEEEIKGGGAAEETEASANGAAEEEQPQGGTAQQAGAQQEDEVEALDLGEASQGVILERIKPLLPIAAGVGALVLVIWLLRRGRSGGQSEWSGGLSGRHGEIEARVRF
jgi:carbon monoxide dehydrogenase subunit G